MISLAKKGEERKQKSQGCCVTFKPKNYPEILLSAHAQTSQANVLHLDLKARTFTTCKRPCGKFYLLIVWEWPENHLTTCSFKTRFSAKSPGANELHRYIHITLFKLALMLEQLERASTIEQSSETNYRYIKLLFSCCFTFWVCITSICFSNEQLLILWDQIVILYCTAVLVLHIHFCLSNNTYLIFFFL